jgi:hypothetical protein
MYISLLFIEISILTKHSVMPGLDPGIHASPLGTNFETIGALPHRVDPRVKPGDDEHRG